MEQTSTSNVILLFKSQRLKLYFPETSIKCRQWQTLKGAKVLTRSLWWLCDLTAISRPYDSTQSGTGCFEASLYVESAVLKRWKHQVDWSIRWSVVPHLFPCIRVRSLHSQSLKNVRLFTPYTLGKQLYLWESPLRAHDLECSSTNWALWGYESRWNQHWTII